MRNFSALMVMLLTVVANAGAQTASRLEVGPVMRFEKLSFDAGGGGTSAVAGVAARFRLTEHFGVEADVTTASSRVERSYEAIVTSTAPGGSSREEIERLGVLARRDLTYVPGVGGSLALTARAKAGPRADVVFRVGGAFRRYLETSNYTVLRMPEGFNPQTSQFLENKHNDTGRGGLLLGFDVPVRITRHLSVGPEVRIVWNGPPRLRKTHREFSIGTRVMWRF